MSAPGLRDLSREDLLQLLRQPNLSAAHAFLKGRPDISLAAVAVNLDRMLNEVPLSRRLRDQQELLARMVRQAIRTDLDSAYAGLADAKPGERSGWEWNSLAVLYLNVESGDVAKSLLKEYPEISGEMVRVLGAMALKTAEGEEADRLRQRLELLDHWSQSTLMWAMQEAQQSEKQLEEEPTMENLRAVAERVRA